MVQEQAQAVSHYEIQVNRVTFREAFPQRTGRQIKEDATAAGVKIQLSYVLDEERPEGNVRIGDDQVVAIHSGLKFVAHPGGSDS